MTRITQPKELAQFEEHKFDYKKTSEDKAYQTFLNSIFNEDGELNKIGGKTIPEEVVEVCRIYDSNDTKKEYLVYDIIQWGYFEDGSKTPIIHLQDIGMWYEYEWVKRPLPVPIYTGTPQRRQFKDYIESSKNRYDIEYNWENVDKLKQKSTSRTHLYVYDTGKSGRGGKSGKIAIDNWEDFRSRPFQELMEGTYLTQTKLEQQLKALQQKEQYLELREKILEGKEQEQQVDQPQSTAKSLQSKK